MARSGRRKCRIWWPTDISSPTPLNSSFLFGWTFPSSAASIDVVVAFSCEDSELTSSINPRLDLQKIIQQTNKTMSMPLQDKSRFSLLGYFDADSGGSDQLVRFRNGTNKCINSTSDHRLNECRQNNERWGCGCPKHDGMLEQDKLYAPGNMWIKLLCSLSENTNGRVLAIPKLDHLHWNSKSITELDLHVLFYGIPVFGGHHYSLGNCSLSDIAASPCKKPNWFHKLQQREELIDLDSIFQAMNSAKAAKKLFVNHAAHSQQMLIVRMFGVFLWQLFAASIASLSTLIYIILQFFHIPLSWLSQTYMGAVLARVSSNSLKNIHFRCCQLLYWPILLHDQSIRYCSCIEFAEKAAFHKHSIWSNVVVDLILGNIFGISLWFMVQPTCLWVSNFSYDFTNNLLRTGCVWLMGNPAGFKLNTELAGVLGIISLNAIQIWSTLWTFMGSLFVYFTKVLALCGIIFGLTSAAALVVDMISLVTVHVSTLHIFLSVLYSTQIQAMASLWRLFRGKKWNPLRHRLDSYDYTIEQHVVGSLLFTPILLLLPTTSVFYIFFTMLHSAVSFMLIFVETVISLIHSTPYLKIFLWLRRKQRFPSGIWFEVTLCISKTGEQQKEAYASDSSESTILVSILHSNYLNFRELLQPHYSDVLSTSSKTSLRSLAYRLLTGKSIPYTHAPSFPMKLQWMAIPWKEYWRLCYDSVFACMEDPI